jgi:outer membrane autotransporter protein
LGVFQPDLHAAWVREFRNHPDVFHTQLENAVDAESDAVTIKTDAPEGHYTAYGGGVLFQLAHAVSGYLDYEELRTLKSIQSHEFTLGLRYQFGS